MYTSSSVMIKGINKHPMSNQLLGLKNSFKLHNHRLTSVLQASSGQSPEWQGNPQG